MSRADRIVSRPFITEYAVDGKDENGMPLIVARKTRDGWWAKKQAELAEKKRSVVPPKSPLDRRIERAIKKATETKQ